MITGYQTDNDGLYLHKVSSTMSMPFGAVAVEPPQEREEGKVVKWNTEIPRYEIDYGTEGTGSWEILDDHRKDTLFKIPSGDSYSFNEGDYTGIGPIPETLTDKPKPQFGFWNITTKDWEVDDVARLESLAQQVRSQRDHLMAQTDWVVVKAQETGTEVPEEYLVYRQALRDVPLQSGFPEVIEWPTL